MWHHHQDQGKTMTSQDVKKAVFSTVARTCRWETTEMMMKMYETSSSAETQKMLRCLALNNHPDTKSRVLDWVMSDRVKLQDKTFFLAGVASTDLTGRSLVWRHFVDNSDHWLSLYKTGRLLINLIRAVTGQGSANTREELEMFEKWFSENKIEGVERNIDQILEEIRSVAELRRSLFNRD